MNIERPSKYSTSMDYIEFMKRQFSDSEYDYMKMLSNDEHKLQHFYRLWCLKESVIKATGTWWCVCVYNLSTGEGIHTDLSTLSFRTKTSLCNDKICSDTVLIDNGVQQQQWKFDECLLQNNHTAAVCTKVCVCGCVCWWSYASGYGGLSFCISRQLRQLIIFPLHLLHILCVGAIVYYSNSSVSTSSYPHYPFYPINTPTVQS
jgi:phosphopantetheinyl transferase (holo-ACP synthase)